MSAHQPVSVPVVKPGSHRVAVLFAIAVAGLAGLGVFLVSVLDDDSSPTAPTATPQVLGTESPPVRYDGGPNEGSAVIGTTRSPAVRYDGGPNEGAAVLGTTRSPAVRYDGGPNEGSAALSLRSRISPPASQRYDGGPNEGSAAITPTEAAPAARYDGGPNEGSAGR